MSPPPFAHAGKRILIVDDVPDNLSVLFAFLTERGFHVFAADGGVQALEELHRIAPDLILLDVVMPGLDGYETCRRIKADAKFAEVPLFFLTALSDTVDKVKGFDLGAVDYITKPLQPAEVVVRINAHLDLRALRADLELRNEELDREIQHRMAAEHSLQHALATPVLVLDRTGTVQFRTEAAAQLLQRHGGLPPPLELRLWFAGAEETEVAASAGRLSVRRLPDPGNPAQALFLLIERAPPATPEPLLALGLTPREAEILFWVAQGKTSPEIAVILDTAPATVKRHVHHILGKLGVETRLAAALRAMEVLAPPG